MSTPRFQKASASRRFFNSTAITFSGLAKTIEQGGNAWMPMAMAVTAMVESSARQSPPFNFHSKLEQLGPLYAMVEGFCKVVQAAATGYYLYNYNTLTDREWYAKRKAAVCDFLLGTGEILCGVLEYTGHGFLGLGFLAVAVASFIDAIQFMCSNEKIDNNPVLQQLLCGKFLKAASFALLAFALATPFASSLWAAAMLVCAGTSLFNVFTKEEWFFSHCKDALGARYAANTNKAAENREEGPYHIISGLLGPEVTINSTNDTEVDSYTAQKLRSGLQEFSETGNLDSSELVSHAGHSAALYALTRLT